MSEYLGVSAPFYMSRRRLELLAQRGVASWKGTLTGKVAVPGVGEISFSRDGQAPGMLAQLERVLSSLGRTGAIGEAWDIDRGYIWVQVTSNISRLRDATNEIDHLVIADTHALVPANWHIFLAGLRTNLVSLDPPESYPELGSSPLSLQAVLAEVLAADSRARTSAATRRDAGTTARLKAACRGLALEQPKWEIGGVVEVAYRDIPQQTLLGSPLFLSLFPR